MPKIVSRVLLVLLVLEILLTGEQLWQKTGGGQWQETASVSREIQ
jgi:hypothetical protein